jgi:hypothetical protein
MINKEDFVIFLQCQFEGRKMDIQYFSSGCIMVDVFINAFDVLVVQIEDLLIGVSLVKDYNNNNQIDLSNMSDVVFNSNDEAENYFCFYSQFL